MNADFILRLIVNPTFIIFISTFAGSIVGEFYREVNDKKICNMAKFTASFLASWLTSASTVIILRSFINFGDRNDILLALSMLYGLNGHKKTFKFILDLVENKMIRK